MEQVGISDRKLSTLLSEGNKQRKHHKTLRPGSQTCTISFIMPPEGEPPASRTTIPSITQTRNWRLTSTPGITNHLHECQKRTGNDRNYPPVRSVLGTQTRDTELSPSSVKSSAISKLEGLDVAAKTEPRAASNSSNCDPLAIMWHWRQDLSQFCEITKQDEIRDPKQSLGKSATRGRNGRSPRENERERGCLIDLVWYVYIS